MSGAEKLGGILPLLGDLLDPFDADTLDDEDADSGNDVPDNDVPDGEEEYDPCK
jgi:hypothetical protein